MRREFFDEAQPAAEVCNEEQTLVKAAKAALARADSSSWEAADTLAGLQRRGWGVRKIAEACATNRQTVSLFIRCANRYPPGTERPAFWQVYREVRPDKEEAERHPTVTGGPPGAENAVARYFRCVRECGKLLIRARGEFLARKRADLLGESREPAEDLDGLLQEVRVKSAGCRQALRDVITEARIGIGYAGCREALTRILIADGLAHSEAVACIDRLEQSALCPEDSDLDLIGDALTGALLREAGQTEEDARAFDAAQQAEEDAVTDEALTLLMARFLQETDRGTDALEDPRALGEWGHWLAARWNIPPVVAEQALSGIGLE
jgi:hypothetical protein